MTGLSPPHPPADPPTGRGANAILFFAFGTAAGILLAFSGVSYLQDSAALIVTVFLSAMIVVLLLGVILFAARRRIWMRLFGVAEVQMEQLASPLATVAERAIAGDPGGATRAARDLVALVLARYSWITTRRWIIASLTALIAAMAALAGTALLFKQNQLIEAQSVLLTEQNARIAEQTLLLSQDVQLAEASRNAALSVEITQIAAELGLHLDRVQAEMVAAGLPADNVFNVLFANTLSRSLVLRISSVSRATKPYRFLDLNRQSRTQDQEMQVALLRRRDELPQTYARLAQNFGWQEPASEAALIDRPASPERGQLLTVLLAAGVLNLETFNMVGLDLSYAHVQGAAIYLLTSQTGQMNYADFSGSSLVQVDLGGASMNGFRCQQCEIQQSSFARVEADRVRPPLSDAYTPIYSRLNGADFQRAVIRDSSFAGAELLAANFDATLMVAPDFTGASLALSTFRGAALLAPVWTGAELKNVDFDGALLFGTDVLADLATGKDFRPDMWRADPVSRAEVMQRQLILERYTAEEVDRLTNAAPAYRLTRVQPFDDGAAP